MLRTLRLQLARWIAPAEEKPGSAAMALPHLHNGESTASAAKALDGAVNISPYHAPKAYDDTLYERARTQWQFGDWESLICIGRGAIESHPERGRLALMVAAAHLQCNNSMAAKQYIRLAQEWGCSKKLIGQILVAGVHNSLGRVAHIKGDETKSLQHFERSLREGIPGSEVKLLARARMKLQGEQLDIAKIENEEAGKAEISVQVKKNQTRENKAPPVNNFSEDAYAFYKTISVADKVGASSPPFILLDSKSLPRAGLHYLKNTLSQVLGKSFSFCEWYQEPGCCRKMPCLDTSYAKFALEKNEPRIRLLKSHDFELKDPNYPTTDVMRRLILVRDPIYQLTSWFALDELNRHSAVLADAGIKMQKIWLSHTPEVIMRAFDVVDASYDPPSQEFLADWLVKRSSYIQAFLEKWLPSDTGANVMSSKVVPYEEIEAYIRKLLMEVRDDMPKLVQEKIDDFLSVEGRSFQKRNNPYQVQSKKISSFLLTNAKVFKSYAGELKPLMKVALPSSNNPED